jgi:hypothetical protein
VTDPLLLNQIADFPNRNTSMKIIEDDKLFFWMAYSEILSELPILNMKKQALRDRFDKLVTLGLLEKKMGRVSNMTFFRLTDKYESLKYDTIVYDTERGCVVNNQGVYSDTQGVCSPLHTISEYKYNNIKEKEIYKEKDVSDIVTMPTLMDNIPYGAGNKDVSKEQLSEAFEDLWLMYEKKGSKANAKKEFAKLTAEEVEAMRLHIPAYLQSRPERQYRQDFERYIKNKTFNSVVYSKQNEILYDPDAATISATQKQMPEFKPENESVTFNGTIYR